MDSTNKNATRNWVIGTGIVIVLIAIFVFVGGNDSAVINTDSTNTASSTTATTTATTTKNVYSTSRASKNTNNGAIASNSIIDNDATLKSLINNLGVRLPETGLDISLVNGVGEATANNQKYTLTSGPILGKVKTDNGYDVFVDTTLTKSSAGSITTTKIKYVTSYHVLNEVVVFKSAAIIGSNVELRGITAIADKSTSVNASVSPVSSVKGYSLSVTYLDRKNGEPVTAEPTVTKTIVLNVKNHIVTR